MMDQRRKTIRVGFTLVEMIIVIVLIGIMAAMTLPRLTGNRDRMFDLATDQVGDLLMMYAQRESLGRRPIGLWEDTMNHRLVLMVLDQDEMSTETTSAWVIDRYVKPVVLPDDVNILDVQAEGQSVDISQWPLQTEPGKNRPAIAIVLEGPERVVTIVLASHALAPFKVNGDNYFDSLGGPIDLDSDGRDREDW
ncbi:MAG: type II secretion system protein [Planctomycetota bacterium]|nr:type II secretion system protein [Planctomycetota bacterium]